jgi:hypothetical protein
MRCGLQPIELPFQGKFYFLNTKELNFAYALYLLTTPYVSPLVISYHDFLTLFAILFRWLLLYTLCVLGGALRF